MGFWMGRTRWWLAPARLKRGVMETIDKVAKEFALIEGIEANLDDYRADQGPDPPDHGRAHTRTGASGDRRPDGDAARRPFAHSPARRAYEPADASEQVTPLVLEHWRAHPAERY